MKNVLKMILQTESYLFLWDLCIQRNSVCWVWTSKARGKTHIDIRTLISFLVQLVYTTFLPLPCPSYPPYESHGTVSPFSIAVFFFSVGLVFFYTRRYMGWFMAAFRPCEWNEGRSSNTRRTGCSRKTCWHNQDSKGKCLMSATVTGFFMRKCFQF